MNKTVNNIRPNKVYNKYVCGKNIITEYRADIAEPSASLNIVVLNLIIMLAAKIIKELIKKLLKYKISMYMVNYITKDIIEQFLKKICQNGGKIKIN